MTVKEILPMLHDPNEVNISWNGDLVCFNFRNQIEVDVWGNFVVGEICAMKDSTFELVLAVEVKPVRKGATE